MKQYMEILCSISICLLFAACSAKEMQPQQIPSYVYPGESQATVEDRTYKLECTPQTPAEGLCALYYDYSITGDYDGLQNCCGSNEALKNAITNEKKQFEDGCYVQAYTVHTLTTQSEQEMSKDLQETVEQDAHKYQLDEYQVVMADISMEWNEKAMSQHPQIDSGEYRRIFLCGIMDKDAEWKIYELYWGEYFE